MMVEYLKTILMKVVILVLNLLLSLKCVILVKLLNNIDRNGVNDFERMFKLTSKLSALNYKFN